MRLWWLLFAFVLSAALAALNLLAFEHFLYWKYEWYDIMMHLLGGLAIGIFLIGFLGKHSPKTYIVLFLGVIVAWEVFEYVVGFTREKNYAADTALDLLMGSVGALVAYALSRISLWRN